MIWAWTPEGKRALDAHREAMKTKPLSQEEVDSLPAGTPVTVIWSGGNGPHRYHTVIVGGTVGVDNAYRDRLHPVVPHPLTQVWLTPSAEEADG